MFEACGLVCRTLPRVRELKLSDYIDFEFYFSRTLPRVRELKPYYFTELVPRIESHPSQGA